MDDKTCSIIKHFDGIVDPRIDPRKLHKLMDIIVRHLAEKAEGNGDCKLTFFGNPFRNFILGGETTTTTS
jgi:hypothetical protein